MDKLEAHARKLLKDRLTRMVRLLEHGAPRAMLAVEAVLIGEAGLLLDPQGCATRAAEMRVIDAKISLGICLGPECEADVATSRHEVARMCATHEAEFSALAGGTQS